jgi:hypothetical protein
MSCCVKDGYCCCTPHHASVMGQVTDDKPHISEDQLVASCPEGCALRGRFSNLLLRNHARTGAPQAYCGPAFTFLERAVAVSDILVSGSSTPRAPPAFQNF